MRPNTMPIQFIASPARFVRFAVAAALALSFLGVECLRAEPIFSVGAKETIYSASKRKSKAASWPDGNFGVLSNGDGTYDFYAANSSKIKVTTGTLNDPAAKKIGTGKIYNVPKKTYDYIAGGPVYEDAASGARLMVYHAETHKKGKYTSVLGLAASVDPKGLAFYDLGPIVAPSMALANSQWSMDIGGGSFAIKDGQFNVYFRDYLADGSSSQLAVARAPLTDLVSNSLNGISTQFTKYHNGSWSQPGVGGLSSPLEVGNPTNWWSSVSYNDYLDQMVMVSSQWQAGGTGPDLYLATSADGVNWSARQPLVLDAGEQMYPTILGTGANPQVTGQSFYVYYTDGKRWSSAQLARRLVTLDPSIPPVLPPLPGPDPGPDPTPMEWVLISDYKDEFQGGGPAAGWKYAWNSNGTLGNAASFSPLLWSESAQAYNTTGAATMVPGSTSHNDDFLQLGADWGHPGKPKYMPIAGYTIQEDDGAGLYRLTDSSIQKTDGITSSKEDGLGVLVYLNNTLMGAAASVSTNGLLANFDRDLGQLNVGDTIWVMIDPLKSQSYDAFKSFDFSLQKSVPLAGGMASMSLMAVGVPEPSSAALLGLALLGCGLCRRPSSRRRVLAAC
ncbi:MAG: PEP-CTERM sorting domain-containing protein [Pirellulales bacterium]